MNRDAGVRWDGRHRNAPLAPPAGWVTENRALLEAQPRGRALDVASGLGRHALLLAELGFDVDALDISDLAIERLATEARRRGLPLRARRADLSRTQAFPRAPYEVVVNTYFLERPLLPALERALAPGGLLIVETFVRSSAERLFQPCDPRFVLEPGELRSAFPGLDLIAEREALLEDEGGRRRAVASLIARSPGAAADIAGNTSTP